MKASLTLLIAATLLSTALTGCGSQLPLGQAVRGPVMAQTARAPQAAPADVQATYYNMLLKAGYSPDHNNSHYGFDFASVSFVDRQGRAMDLDIKYYPALKSLWLTLREQDVPLNQFEHIDQKDTSRMAELIGELRGLRGGNAEAKAALSRVVTILEKP